MDNEKKQVTYNSSISGETQVTFDIQQYTNGAMFIGLMCNEDGYEEPFGDVTVNLSVAAPNYCGYLNVNDMPDIEEFITDNDIGEFYGDSVNMDMIKFCSLMHDVGKLFDYESQTEFSNKNTLSMNQALLGHGFEGAIYVAGKLKTSYEDNDISVSKDYVKSVITQVTHCIGAHMDGFGACAKQQMFEVLIIGCADKVDAYLEQTIVRDDENSFVIGTGETFYKATVDTMKVFSVENILRDDLH